VSKILSQTGVSLADVYDIEGSIVGVEDLRAEEVQTVHEMGSTIFSERFRGTISRAVTGDIAQSQTFNVIVGGFPPVVNRINGIVVWTETIARLDRITVSIHDPLGSGGRDLPIFVWNSAVDSEIAFQVEDNGSVVPRLLLRVLTPLFNMPTFLVGEDQPESVPNISIRGTTLAFGAGTIEATVVLSLAFSNIGGVSSYGLPIPSW